MNSVETAKLLAYCAAMYPQYPVTKQTVEVYAEMLSDLDAVQTQLAVRDLLATSDRWPSVAAIRRRYAERAGVLAPSKAEAWGEVRKAISEHGRRNRPDFSHPLVARTVEIMGWHDLCNADNLDVTRSQFWKVYEDLQKRDDMTVLTAPTLDALPSYPRLQLVEG